MGVDMAPNPRAPMHTRTHTTHEHMRSQIRHYAGSVCYTSTGFMDKNKDTLQMDLSKCMNTATNELIAMFIEYS